MKQTKRVLAQTICLLAVICLATFAGIMAMAAPPITQYTITNPYENVNWTEYGQYKANFHAHSTNSDGGNLTADMVEDHYAKGFDILSMTDHDYTTASWDTVARGPLSAARKAEIQAGIGRGGKPMIEINYTNEQSVVDHINSFWADFNNASGATMATTIAKVEELGGITHINHAGRYTGGANSNDATSIAASNNPANIKKYVDLFKAYPSCVGMEIINKIDNESKSDRILWDNVLKEMMPQGRFVWGFSNDDTHSLNATGYSWNIMLMPELSQAATRDAMESGAFYAVSRVSRLDGINRYYPGGGEVRGDGAAATLYLLEQPTPSISNIVVNQQAGTISLSGDDYDTIEWIADGTVIATGSTLKLSDHDAKISSYVRAQLKSATGIAFTQPFGITRAEIDLYTVPAQIAATMTQDPQHSMSITWTTIDTALVNPQVTVTANGESKTFNAVKTVRTVSSSNLRTAANAAITQKAFYTADLTGLTSNTKYTYVCSAQNAAGSETYSSKACTFVTAPEGKDEYTFIYLSDTQSSGVNGKAITANTSVFKEKYPNASFIYIAGDLTDTSTNEGQWEMFFNQKADSYANTGLVNNNFENAMSDYAIAAAQGNHDNNTFANHLTFPADGGTNITYAYTYGSARFIILNFENTATRAAQEAFLRTEVAKAKAAGLWTIVGYHKSLYSGASHIVDSDVRTARTFWSPIFAELDVDAVLQGHDHVLSRGFVKGDGYNGGNVQKIADRIYTANLPSNAPLYYVANCASTLKFYSASNYTVQAGDPISFGYEFLDLNSCRAAGHVQNPLGPQTSDSYQGPTYVAVTVSNKAITFDTYMFRYSTSTDTITTEPFLYDSLTVTRSVLEDEVTLEISDVAAAPGGSVDVTYSIKGNNLGFTTLDFELPYNGKIYQPTLITPAAVLGNGSTGYFVANPSFGGKDIIKISYASNTKVAADGLLFTVTYKVAADALFADEKLAADVIQAKLAVTDTSFAEINLQVSPGTLVIGLLGDIDGNGKITPEDAMLLLQMHVGLIPWTPRALLLGDVNGDGQIDPVDAALILRMVVGGGLSIDD